ncbi:MAG TPA: GNAT family N-acetyltransferase [Rhizomicrobium sp.]|nr:GNAT family N-acetyltransferase [Rhizomicrobium sp.]
MIERLTPAHAEELRDIRLEALRLHPTAFSADPEVEGAFTLEHWRERIEHRCMFGGRVDGRLAGINAFSLDTYSKKTAHVATLGAMYVREAARGTGLAGALMTHWLDHAARSGAEMAVLDVEATNRRAIALYERHGFKILGRKPRSMKVDGIFYDELEMWREITSPA